MSQFNDAPYTFAYGRNRTIDPIIEHDDSTLIGPATLTNSPEYIWDASNRYQVSDDPGFVSVPSPAGPTYRVFSGKK